MKIEKNGCNINQEINRKIKTDTEKKENRQRSK